MLELIKREFDILARKNWIRVIQKEVNKRNRLKDKLFQQEYVVDKLVERFNELYSDDSRGVGDE